MRARAGRVRRVRICGTRAKRAERGAHVGRPGSGPARRLPSKRARSTLANGVDLHAAATTRWGTAGGWGGGGCVWNERCATRKALSEAVGLGAREAWHGLSGGWCTRCATQARRGWLRGRRRDGGPRRRSPGWSIARDRDHHLKHEEGGRGVERRPLRRGEHGHPRLDDITTPTRERRQPSGGDTHSWP